MARWLAPNINIFLKSIQIRTQILQNGSQNRAKINPKSTKSEPGGTPKRQQEAKMNKRGGVSNSAVVFYAILEENGLQDGAQNRSKITKKSIQKTTIL